MDEIPIENWIALERKRLDEFTALWRDGAVKEPENYPVILSVGDWDEQYRCWGGG